MPHKSGLQISACIPDIYRASGQPPARLAAQYALHGKAYPREYEFGAFILHANSVHCRIETMRNHNRLARVLRQVTREHQVSLVFIIQKNNICITQGLFFDKRILLDQRISRHMGDIRIACKQVAKIRNPWNPWIFLTNARRSLVADQLIECEMMKSNFRSAASKFSKLRCRTSRAQTRCGDFVINPDLHALDTRVPGQRNRRSSLISSRPAPPGSRCSCS